MFNTEKRDGHSPSRLTRRRGMAFGASAAGALAAVAFAIPAGAAVTPQPGATYPAPAQNNVIVGSGSSTDYNMMQSLDTLFNQVPGCVITSGSVSGAPTSANQQLDFSCETNGATTLEQVPGSSFLDNPINDAAVEEAPMGSSNGIAQLELDRNNSATGIGTTLTGTSSENVSAVNYARSSRDLSNSKDVKGLNFVAYAKDGVSPLVWSKFGGVTNPETKAILSTTVAIPNTGNTTVGLTQSELQGIYNGSIYDWGQLGAKTSDPIYVYSAQEGSGTQSTFKTYLGTDPSSPSNHVNCTDPVHPGTTVVTKTSKTVLFTTFQQSTGTPAVISPLTTNSATCLGPDVIFENETASIIANASTPDTIATAWESQNSGAGTISPVGDSIFFYSFGKFNLQCEGFKQQTSYVDHSKSALTNIKVGTDCGSTPLPTALAGDKLALPDVAGIADNPQTILADGPTSAAFPITRFLYNIYSNGSNTNIPEASAATLNYVSEVGFLCKPQTINGSGTVSSDTPANEIIDPFTGVWYHTEIFNSILTSGFIPVTANASTSPQFGLLTDGPAIAENASASADTNTAYPMLNAGTPKYGAAYLNSSVPTGTTPSGYCVLFNTDGASAS